MSPFVNEIIKLEVLKFKHHLVNEFGGKTDNDYLKLNVVSHKEMSDTSAVFYDENYMGEMGVRLDQGNVKIFFNPKVS